MRGQSRRHSMLEVIVNVAVGFGVAVLAQIAVFPWFGIRVPLSDNILIASAFTVVSIVRSYVLRRAFNWWHIRQGRMFR